MRLIDADAFERAVMFSDDEDLQDVIYRLRDFPSAEPQRTTPGNIVIGSDGWLVYCPLCGAKMVKGGDDE